ncbi:glycoside hydrolase, partial [Microdochium bolleyi]
TAVLAAAIVPSAYGHYFWNRLIVDGVETRDNEFVRRTTRPTAYNPIKWKNSRDNSTPDLDDIRCNQGAFSSAGSTGVKEVKAGSQVGFKLAVGATMQHPGPIIAYVSRAPGSVKEYRGDDDWIKIYEQGVCDTTKDFTKEAWCSWDKDRVNFPLPKELPDGEYLLRIEHIGLHGAHDGQAEFYPACAQIKVTGGSPAGGSLGEGIKLPGGYKPTDPSFAFSLWNGYKPYPMPGGPMFKGVTGGSGNANGGSSSSAAPT